MDNSEDNSPQEKTKAFSSDFFLSDHLEYSTRGEM